jgi:adenosine deaminase CECR1
MIFLLVVILLLITCQVSSDSSYDKLRDKWLKNECETQIGGGVSLSSKEKRVDEILRDAKAQMYNSERFPASINFLETNKKKWEESALFKLLKPLPKGAVLHLHVDAQLTGEFMVKTATYDSACFVCGGDVSTEVKNITFRFFEENAVNESLCSTGWRRVTTLREKSMNRDEFDLMLSKSMAIYLEADEKYEDVFPTVNSAWNSFQPIFFVMSGLFLYRPYHEVYAEESMRILSEDNVQYVELRANLVDFVLYEKNQTEHRDNIDVFLEIWEKAARKYGIGLKFIQSTLRNSDPDVVELKLRKTQELRRDSSKIIAAFDLVGQEDLGRPLIDFVDVFAKYEDVPLALHAGETKWKGFDADQNILDAVLLNTSRIGHGFNLNRWHQLSSEVKSRGIAIEVNPISNQVLGLVQDLRDHPLVNFLSDNMPVVLSPDDPGLWNISGVTYDWYVSALISGDSTCSGISVLKQLAKNSLTYSFMNDTERVSALSEWETRWDHYLDWALLFSDDDNALS